MRSDSACWDDDTTLRNAGFPFWVSIGWVFKAEKPIFSCDVRNRISEKRVIALLESDPNSCSLVLATQASTSTKDSSTGFGVRPEKSWARNLRALERSPMGLKPYILGTAGL